MNCENPIDIAALAEYWAGALPAAEEATIEEHLFACDECSARMPEAAALAECIRHAAQAGSLLMVVSDALLRRAAEGGLRIREYAPARGGSVECTVTADDDLLIGRLTADLSESQRVDLSLCDERGRERARLSDIPFDSRAGSVAFQQPIGYAKAAPSETMIARLVALDEAGREKLLGEYTFKHTRSIPGPAAW
jgi:anti-sigma factor RsiW